MDWSLALWAGIVGGLVMGAWAMMMRFAGFTRMSVPRYLGCIVTGRHEGTGTYLTGMTIHLVFSIGIAFVYAWIFAAIWQEATWLLGLVVGLGHWLVGGLFLRILDSVNSCVQRGTLQALEIFGKGYGGNAILTFLVGHLIFGTVVGWIYAVPLS